MQICNKTKIVQLSFIHSDPVFLASAENKHQIFFPEISLMYCNCEENYLLNPYAANVENMVRSYQC
jgi:hypothetical protein